MSVDRLSRTAPRGKLGPYTETRVANGTATGTVGLDLTAANVFDLTLTGATTLQFNNPPASGDVQSFTLIVRQDATGGRTLTLPASVDWPGGTAPTLVTTASAVNILVFTTVDGGTTWLGATAGIDVK